MNFKLVFKKLSLRFLLCTSLALMLVVTSAAGGGLCKFNNLLKPSVAFASDADTVIDWDSVTHAADDLIISGDNLVEGTDYKFVETPESQGSTHYRLYVTTNKPVTIKNKDANNLNDTQIYITNKIEYNDEDGAYPLTSTGTADITLDGINLVPAYTNYSGGDHICSPIMIGGNNGDGTLNVNLHIKSGSRNYLYGNGHGEDAVINKPQGKESGTLRIDGDGELHVDGHGTTCIGSKDYYYYPTTYVANIYFDHPNLWLSDRGGNWNSASNASLIGFESYSTDDSKIDKKGLYNITFDGGNYHLDANYGQTLIGCPIEFGDGQKTLTDPGNETRGIYIQDLYSKKYQGQIENCTIKNGAYFDCSFNDLNSNDLNKDDEELTFKSEPIQNMTTGNGWTFDNSFIEWHSSVYEIKWEYEPGYSSWMVDGYGLADDQSADFNSYFMLGKEVTPTVATTITKGNLDIPEGSKLTVSAEKKITVDAGGTVTNYGTLENLDNINCTDNGAALSAVTFDATPGKIPSQDDPASVAANTQLYKVAVKNANGLVNCQLPTVSDATDDYGYDMEFKGWYTEADGQGTALSSEKPMDVNNHRGFAYLLGVDMSYVVDVYTENIDGTYSLAKTITMPDQAPTNVSVSVSADDIYGTELDDGDVLGTQYVFDEENAQNNLSGFVGAIQDADSHLKIYYKLKPVTLTFNYTGDVPSGVSAPSAINSAYKKTVEFEPPQGVNGYSVSGWKQNGQDVEGNSLTMGLDDVVLTATWTKNPEPPVAPGTHDDVTPDDNGASTIIPSNDAPDTLAGTGDINGNWALIAACMLIGAFALFVAKALRKEE